MRKAILVLAVVAVVACKKKKAEDKTPPPGSGTAMAGTADTGSGTAAGTGAGTGSAAEPAGSGSAAAGSGSAAARSAAPMQAGFARFDDGAAGKPWITDDEAKAGIVELIADVDLSGKEKNKFETARRCGDAAKKAAESTGNAMVKRWKAGSHDPTECKEIEGVMACFQGGVGEGDQGLELNYKKTGDAWTLVGVKSYGMGVALEKQEAQFKKLLDAKCK